MKHLLLLFPLLLSAQFTGPCPSGGSFPGSTYISIPFQAQTDSTSVYTLTATTVSGTTSWLACNNINCGTYSANNPTFTYSPYLVGSVSSYSQLKTLEAYDYCDSNGNGYGPISWPDMHLFTGLTSVTIGGSPGYAGCGNAPSSAFVGFAGSSLLPPNISVLSFGSTGNELTPETLDLSSVTTLTSLTFLYSGFSGSFVKLGGSSLTYLDLHCLSCTANYNNSPLAGVPAGFSSHTRLTTVNFNGWGGDSSDVNSVLQTLVTNGITHTSCSCTPVVNIASGDGQASAPPTGAGITNKATLITRGWSVTTD